MPISEGYFSFSVNEIDFEGIETKDARWGWNEFSSSKGLRESSQLFDTPFECQQDAIRYVATKETDEAKEAREEEEQREYDEYKDSVQADYNNAIGR